MDLSGAETLAVASQLAVVLAVSVVIGLVGGSFLDARLGTGHVFVIVGAILGTAAGIYTMVQTTSFLVNHFQQKRANPKGSPADTET
jgi:F0F1-type ATP synthase assembly protein I